MSSAKDLTVFLSLPTISDDPALAVDALVEFIQGRRKSGQAFYEIMVTLIETMQKVPPTLDPCFDLARTLCHIPPLANLSPTSESPFARKAYPSALLSRVVSLLARCPQEVSLESARESVLEWCLGMEGRIMYGKGASLGLSATEGDSKGGEGRGGSGTIAMSGFDEIEGKFKEIIIALSNPEPDVLALLLSLRLTLSYLSFPSLLHQLQELSLPDSESVLCQWVKRRLPGEGRFTIGEQLNMIEREAGESRPALKAVIKLVKAKYLLPEGPVYRIPLPSPGKNKILAAIQAFVVTGGPSKLPTDRVTPPSPIRPGPSMPASARPPAYRTPSGSGPVNISASKDFVDKAASAYATEILSEWLTREKRDYMRAERWIRSGRKTLSRELNEIEEKLCTPTGGIGPGGRSRKGKEVAFPNGTGTSSNPHLQQVFALMRRVYNLDAGGSSASATPNADYPAIDLPDEWEQYHPPTAQSVTSSLYCNPRLSTDEAVAKLLDFVDCEKDKRIQSAVATLSESRRSSRGRWSNDDGEAVMEQEERDMREVAWGYFEKAKMGRTLEGIARRFPDGEYEDAFIKLGEMIDCPPRLHRAPSYKSVASAFTAERTASYLRGTTHPKGLASINRLTSGSNQIRERQGLTTQATPSGRARPDSPQRSFGTDPDPHSGTGPPTLERRESSGLPAPPVRPSSHARSSSLPITSALAPRLHVIPVLPILSIPSLSSLIADAVPTSIMLEAVPNPTEEISPAREIDLEAFYAGYGDAIQPLTPDTTENPHQALRWIPARFSETFLGPAGTPGDLHGRGVRSGSASAAPSTLDRSREVVMPRRADAPSTRSPIEVGPAHAPGVPHRLGHTRQSSSLSPSSWRQEFMQTTLLKPGSRPAAIGK